MKTPSTVHSFSNRPSSERIPDFDYEPSWKVLKVNQNGAFRWKSYY
ncbi:MAG: hypothetical protein WBN28_13175 [Lutimonas sp.]|jgi:hypothetical protein